ncbi:MAG: hypothetical protein ACE5DN_07215, partial [Flavobacteriales bacterium]
RIAQHNCGNDTPDRNEFDKISFRFHYANPVDRFIRGASYFISGSSMAGLQTGRVGAGLKSPNGKTYFYSTIKIMYRIDSTDAHYLLYPEYWTTGKHNSTLNFGLNHNYRYPSGNGQLNINLRTSALPNDYNFSALNFTALHTNNIGKTIFKTRTFLQLGLGDLWPEESRLYLAGANPEELMINPFTRATGFIPSDWTGYGSGINHFHAGGGLNLRGYAGYLAPFEDDSGLVRSTNRGTSGAAVNAELEFNRFIRWNPRFLRNTFKLTTYLFGDAGLINANTVNEPFLPANFRADAGVGAALTIRRWGVLELVNPLTIRFDMPLWLNRIPASEQEYFAFRWMFGVSRAF